MTTETVQTAPIAALPRVNLLPPEIAEAARFRQVQLAMGGAVLVAALAVAGLYVHAKSGVHSAQNGLTTAQSQQAGLQSQLAGLQSVKATYADLQAKRALLSQAMSQEIRWSYVLDDLSLRIPNDVWLTSVDATENGVGSADSSSTSATSSTTTTTDGLGTVTFTGTGLKHADVASWLDVLAAEKGFIDPSFSSSTENNIGSRHVDDFSTSVGLGSDALSNRYTLKAGN